MNKKIRAGVFETNSSSVHAVTISTDEPTVDDYPYVSEGGDFGWEHEFYCITDECLDYLWQCIWDNHDSDRFPGDLDEWRGIIRNYLPNAQLLDVPDYNSLDHAGELIDMLEDMYDNHALLGRFLTGGVSQVETWNDNQDGFNIDWFSTPYGDNWVRYIKDN